MAMAAFAGLGPDFGGPLTRSGLGQALNWVGAWWGFLGPFNLEGGALLDPGDPWFGGALGWGALARAPLAGRRKTG